MANENVIEYQGWEIDFPSALMVGFGDKPVVTIPKGGDFDLWINPTREATRVLRWHMEVSPKKRPSGEVGGCQASYKIPPGERGEESMWFSLLGGDAPMLTVKIIYQ